MGSGDALSGKVNIHLEGKGGAVGGPTPNTGGVSVGYRLRGGSQEEMIVVETGFNIGRSKEKS